jgi:hypothetical protein
MVYGWGSNAASQLGIAAASATTPTQVTTTAVAGLSLADQGVVQVACGVAHSIALTRNGTIWVWGTNAAGQLGTFNLGDTGSATRPYAVQLYIDSILYKRRISAVAGGDTHTVALVDDGYVYTWGKSTWYGGNTPVKLASSPALVNRTIVYINAGGSDTTLMVDNTGVLLGMGLGYTTAPQVISAQLYEAAYVGQTHTLLVDLSHKTVAFGTNTFGMLLLIVLIVLGQLGDTTVAAKNGIASAVTYGGYNNRVTVGAAVGASYSYVLYDSTNSCFGYLPDEYFVCGTHGRCIARDYCLCDAGYSGPVCDEWTCNGSDRNTSFACSGNGNCVASNYCGMFLLFFTF